MAQETLDGAAAYGLDAVPTAPSVVGLHVRGEPHVTKLKFNHLGLATTATRTGGRSRDPERYRLHRRACHRHSRQEPDW